MQYQRNDQILERGKFRLRGDVIEIYPAYFTQIAYRISLDFNSVESIHRIHPLTGEILEDMEMTTIYAAKHFVMPWENIRIARERIEAELKQRHGELEKKD